MSYGEKLKAKRNNVKHTNKTLTRMINLFDAICNSKNEDTFFSCYLYDMLCHTMGHSPICICQLRIYIVIKSLTALYIYIYINIQLKSKFYIHLAESAKC